MATAYTSSFSWSNGIAASGREGDRDRDRVRAGVSRSGFRSSRPYLTAPDHDRLSGLVTEVKKMLGALRRKLMADG